MRASRLLVVKRRVHESAPMRAQQLAARRAEEALENVQREQERVRAQGGA